MTEQDQRGRRRARGWAATWLAAALACSGANKAADEGSPATPDGTQPSEASQAVPASIELGPVTKGSLREHGAPHVWVMGDGAPTKMNIGEAEARGFTVIDLSDNWVPYIFSNKTPGVEDEHENAYRKLYIGLANDRVDSDGDKLREGDHNYLELYGIPPSLAVVEADWNTMRAEVTPCLDAAGFDASVFTAFEGSIAFKKSRKTKATKSARYYRAQLFKKMRRAKLDPTNPADLETAADDPKLRSLYKRWRGFQGPVDVIDHAQRRFRCEKMFTAAKGEGKFKPGVYDSGTNHALARFEKKHDVMGWGHFKKDNLAVLALSPEEATHQRLLRVVAERVISSAGIVEDGSAARWKSKFRWKDKAGKEHELRDLAKEFTDAAVEALDLGTPESAKAKLQALRKLNEDGFEQLLVAVKMPPLPEYYSQDMEFDTVINRGDVWYDFPYDEEGNKKSQPRRRYPHITVYAHYRDQRIPIIHWRTTIGSWRNEVKDGDVMLKYKNSDVGARVWKDIVASPVWIPPASTPPGELIKGKWKNGKFRRGVNYDEIGPGYKSAYGLVAAYHIKQIKDEEGNVKSEFDNSIRTHGSVDYMSILRRFSHGCHRLYNMDAVRLFSFILLHRQYERLGTQTVGVGRVLEHEERTYRMKINTRGYKYQLAEPIPVMVTRGRIRGRRRGPIEEYVPKPVKPEDELELLEGTDPATPGAAPATTPSPAPGPAAPTTPVSPTPGM